VVFPFVVDSSGRQVTATFNGPVRGADIADTVGAIYYDPAWKPGMHILYDARGITQLLMDPEDMPRIVAAQHEHEARAGKGVDVILVARALDFAMAQMYEKLARGAVRQTYVTKSEEYARRLLGEDRSLPDPH
jgi:hypothetical protein